MAAISSKITITFWPCSSSQSNRSKCGPIFITHFGAGLISDIDIGPLIGNATASMCQAVNKLQDC